MQNTDVKISTVTLICAQYAVFYLIALIYQSCKVIESLGEFKSSSDIILVNRKSKDFNDVAEKCFSIDLFRNG